MVYRKVSMIEIREILLRTARGPEQKKDQKGPKYPWPDYKQIYSGMYLSWY